MRKKEKGQQRRTRCTCCGVRMEIAKEIAPDTDGMQYCTQCGPRPTKAPYCPRCEHQR